MGGANGINTARAGRLTRPSKSADPPAPRRWLWNTVLFIALAFSGLTVGRISHLHARNDNGATEESAGGGSGGSLLLPAGLRRSRIVVPADVYTVRTRAAGREAASSQRQSPTGGATSSDAANAEPPRSVTALASLGIDLADLWGDEGSKNAASGIPASNAGRQPQLEPPATAANPAAGGGEPDATAAPAPGAAPGSGSGSTGDPAAVPKPPATWADAAAAQPPRTGSGGGGMRSAGVGVKLPDDSGFVPTAANGFMLTEAWVRARLASRAAQLDAPFTPSAAAASDHPRAWRGRNTRAVAGALAADDFDGSLLSSDDEDPYAGVVAAEPTLALPLPRALGTDVTGDAGGADSVGSGAIDKGEAAAAGGTAVSVAELRARHAAAAELAVVVVSGPRLGAGASRDTSLPSYWRYAAASCDGIAATLATLERPAGAGAGAAGAASGGAAAAAGAAAGGAGAAAAGAGAAAGPQAAAAADAASALWVAALAAACDATPLCRGFHPASGRLLTRVDRASCTGVADVRVGPGVGIEGGVYSKSAVTVAPQAFPLWLPTRPPGQAPPLPLPGDGAGSEVGLTPSALLASGLGPDAAAILLRAVRLVGGPGAPATNAAAVGPGASTLTDAATTTSDGWGFELWWAAAGADVYKEDLGPSGVAAPQQGGDAAHIVALAQHCRKQGPPPASASAPASAASAAVGSGAGSVGGCAGAHWPSGWLKTSSDSGVLHFGGGAMAGDGASAAGLYLSRAPIPPLDYVSDTVISLLREMGGGVADLDGAGAAGLCYGAEGDGSGSGRSSEGAAGAAGSTAGAAAAVTSQPARAFRGRTHLYVVDTSSEAMHALPQGSGASYTPAAGAGAAGAGAAVAPLTHDAVLPQRYTPRALQGQAGSPGGNDGGGSLDVHGPPSPDYWFHAFAYLRQRFGHLPCVTFLPHGAYPRLRETAPPAKGRGQPGWHADNRRKSMERGKVSQTLDFVGGLRAAAALSPRAHAMVWEDDAHACNGTLRLLAAFTGALDSGLDPRWGMVRVGNGGSGLLVQREVVSGLTPYLVTRRGSENVDVSMWRYAHSGGYPDYISRLSWSAHRGLYSSFRGGAGAAPTWGRVHCTNQLDFHWGWMKDCDVSRLTAGAAGAGAGAVAGRAGAAATQQQQQSPLPRAELAALFSQFRCSVYSPATDGVLQRP